MFLAKNKTLEVPWLIGYILLLFLSAIVRDFVIDPYVAHHIHGVGAILVEPVWKLLFWIAPTFLYIQIIEGQNPLTYLKLTAHPLKGLAWGLYGSLFVVALELGNILRLHTLHVPQSADTWVNAILLVGLMEEIPFRGFLFQKLQSLFGSSWVGLVGAMLISSLLFALIHIPLWISTGLSLFQSFFGFLLVFFVGIIACVALKISESLWSSILIHTVYNVLTSLF
jgi:membrane protease YdiL (CAAX protease family)